MKKTKKSKNLILRPNLYDYLKLLAILTMIVDHIGYYLYPELELLRWVGRFAFPIFLFLVGFNGKYQRKWSLAIRAIGLRAAMAGRYYMTGIGSWTANILVVIVLVRMRLHLVSTRIQGQAYWWMSMSSVLLFAMHPRLKGWLDYGSLGFFFALRGMLAHQQSVSHFFLGGAAMLGLWIQNMLVFQFGYASGEWCWLRALWWGYVLLYLLLLLLTKSNLRLRCQSHWDICVVRISRNALLIYGLHILVLLLLAELRRMGIFSA